MGYQKKNINLGGTYKQIRLRSSQTSSYDSNMNCVITFKADTLNKMMVYFKDLNLENPYDFVQLFDGPSTSSNYIGTRYKYSGSSYPSTVYTTTGKYLTIKFVSDSNMEYSGVDLIITQFHTGVCTSDEYRCDNGRCIYNSKSCTAYNSCGDHTDCNNNTGITGSQAGSVAGIVVGTIFCIMLITCVLIMIRRRRRDIIVRSRPAQSPRVHTTVASATIGQMQISAPPPPPPYSQSQYDNQMGPPPPYSQVQYLYPPKEYNPTT